MKVIVYSTKTCPYCDMLKDFLKEKGVEFEEIDVSQNQEKAREMVEKSGQMGVPVTEINGKIIVGFNKEAIEEALKGEESEPENENSTEDKTKE
ncbi:MAG: glutaredoxin family protein [Nanoarchaeota archaeon]|nr:glutaredoxin family protein [Nanoarchaeota archaeon]MBU2520232.1 glutaredoxin family protein [Nanoarchaeota archaeon]